MRRTVAVEEYCTGQPGMAARCWRNYLRPSPKLVGMDLTVLVWGVYSRERAGGVGSEGGLEGAETC